MPDDPMPTVPPIIEWALLAVAVGIVATLAARGVFRERTFQHAPRRVGPIALPDLAAIVGLFILGMVAASLAIHAASEWGLEDPGQRMAINVILSPLAAAPAVGYGVWVMHRGLDGGLRAWGIDAANLKRGLLWGTVGFLLALPVVGVGAGLVIRLLAWLDHPVPPIAHQTLQAIIDDPPGPIALTTIIVGVVVLAPLVEELLFRGLMQTILSQRSLLNGRWRAILATSVIFAVIHLPAVNMADEPTDPPPPEPTIAQRLQPDPPADVPGSALAATPVTSDAPDAEPGSFTIAWPALTMLFLLSVAMGLAYEKTGSLYTPIVMHLLFNAYNVTMAILLYT